MRTDQDHCPAAAATETDIAGLVILWEGLAGTLRTAEALVRSGRRVDLDGLDRQVRTLCCLVLALPDDQAAQLRPKLHSLVVRTDALLAAIAAAAARPAP